MSEFALAHPWLTVITVLMVTSIVSTASVKIAILKYVGKQ